MCQTHLLSVLSFHSVVPLHDMGVQRLLVLRRVVATLPVAREPIMRADVIQFLEEKYSCERKQFWKEDMIEPPYVLSFPMLLPCVLVQQVFVAVSLSTGCAHVLF